MLWRVLVSRNQMNGEGYLWVSQWEMKMEVFNWWCSMEDVKRDVVEGVSIERSQFRWSVEWKVYLCVSVESVNRAKREKVNRWVWTEGEGWKVKCEVKCDLWKVKERSLVLSRRWVEVERFSVRWSIEENSIVLGDVCRFTCAWKREKRRIWCRVNVRWVEDQCERFSVRWVQR